ncbi:MAG: DUF4249 domain-containing protein [Leadbetterella sp.]
MKRYLLYFLFLFFQSCVDPFDVEFSTKDSYYIVDGRVSNIIDEPSLISLFKTSDSSNFKSSEFTSSLIPNKNDISVVSNAEVIIVENNSKEIRFEETSPGNYTAPFGFIGTEGNTYKLKVRLPDGQQLQSSDEKMPAAVLFDAIYDDFNIKEVDDKNYKSGKFPTTDVYVDFVDPSNQTNFYQWKWTSFETQKICKSCKQSYLNGTTQNCDPDRELIQGSFFDYECRAICWDILESNQIDVLTDKYINGLPQKRKQICNYPVYQSNPVMIYVYQFSITPNQFRYLQLLKDQSVNTGTLADTPPAPIQGNVQIVDKPKELVMGYFSAASADVYRYFLERKNVGDNVGRDQLFKIQNRRDPILEVGTNRPIPYGNCTNSKARTSIAPIGWRFGF